MSANRYWRTFQPKGFAHAVTTLSKEAKAYKLAVKRIVVDAGITAPITGRVKVSIALYPFRPQDWLKRARANPLNWDDDVRSLDLDNANKVLLDALKGLVFEDDKMVFELWSKRCEPDDGGGRVVVHIEPIVREEIQPALFDLPAIPQPTPELRSRSNLPPKPF